MRHMILIPALGAALVLAATAAADVLPPQAAEAAQRLRSNPNAFDRTDQFCADKRPGDACAIPGSMLANGGAGECRNAIDRRSFTIDLYCARTASIVIERGVPDGGFMVDARTCASFAGQPLPEGLTCTPPTAMPVDRFCTGKDVGASCTAELRQDGAATIEAGRCTVSEEVRDFYMRGRGQATRQLVLCAALEAPIERVFTAVPWFQKLLQ